ncbi:MAG: translation initiation factor IF-3 [Patescibacteria group bacterium]
MRRQTSRQSSLYYRTNWQIRSPNLRVIGSDGKQIGILPLAEARNLSQKAGLDLVEIAPRANPPVAKITNYAKYKYEQEKKQKETNKKSKKGEKVKEIQLTPFIGEADLKTRLSRARKFSKEGARLKFVVKFIGRQNARKEFGHQLLDRITLELADYYQPESSARQMGKRLIIMMNPVVPTKGKKKNEEKQGSQEENQKID